MSALATSAAAPEAGQSAGRKLSVLGVGFLDWTRAEALERLTAELRRKDGPARSVYFVNAATLNLASQDAAYRDVLNAGDYVFGDGTGARIGARLLHGARLQDNVNGTDLTPALFAGTAFQGLRYFLLGATAEAIDRASVEARRLFPGWEQAGHHHGYLTTPELERSGHRPDQRLPQRPVAGGHGQPAAGKLDSPSSRPPAGAAGDGHRGPVHLLVGRFDAGPGLGPPPGL